MISLVVAMANKRVIGKDQQMPWHMPADLAHFKKVTLGHPIIMGRKTYESIGRPLPGRQNIVVTRQNITIDGCDIAHSLDEALSIVNNKEQIMIIGGGVLFLEALPIAQRLHLTLIDLDVEGDTFFPEWNPDEWQMISEEAHAADSKNPYDYRFITLERISNDDQS